MILDNLSNLAHYGALHAGFAKAAEYLQSNDWNSLADGKYDIAEGLKLLVITKPGISQAESIAKFECHDKNIDIQILVYGNESIGWKYRQDCSLPKGEYNAEKDVMFYNDAPTTYFSLQPNEFVIFYPNDVHAPMIGEGDIKKLVFKVKI